jgi:hypothetical protein
MKKILTIMLLTAMCLTGTYAQKKKTAARNSLKQVVVLEQKFDKPGGKPIKDTETFFDSKGNVTEEIEYDNGRIKYHVKYEYDDDEEKTKETELNAAGKVSKVTEFKNDDEGRRIKEIESDGSGKVVKTIEYKYNGDLKTERRCL